MTAAGRRVRGVVLVAVVIAAYVAVVLTYALGSPPNGPDLREAAPDAALVYLDVDTVSGENFSLDARVSVYPGTELTDADGNLVDDLIVDVTPTASAGTLTFPSGTRVGPLPVSLYADGDIRRWPFDTYDASSIQVRVFSGAGADRQPVPAEIVVTDSLTSWAVEAVDIDATSAQAFDIRVSRTVGTTIFDIAICVVLVVLPMCTLFVSIQTLRRRKQFLPPIMTWFAVTLFAVLPIRNLFPGAPPIGSWVDYTVVLWVVAGLVTAMVLYVVAWWRQGP